jgi:hypothetical protein
VPARAATPFDAPRIGALLERSTRTPETILASALPLAFAAGTITGTGRMALGLVGLGGGRLRVFLEQYRGQLRSVALVYDGRRPEWVILLLAPVLLAITRFVIAPEERYLRRRFGADYDAYMRRVRRWV